MVFTEKQLCFCRKCSSSHLGFYCQTHALIFHGKRTGQELLQRFLIECGENTKSSSHLRNMEKSWKGFKAVVANLQSFSPLDSFILGVECSTWSQLRVAQNNPIFLCVLLQQSMELALLNSSHGARATQTPKTRLCSSFQGLTIQARAEYSIYSCSLVPDFCVSQECQAFCNTLIPCTSAWNGSILFKTDII